MKKILMTIGMVVLLFFCGDISTNAIEMNIQYLTGNVDVKEQTDINSETIVTLKKGTPIWVLEEEQNWKKIRYQDYTGYINTQNFNPVVSSEDLEEIDEEFKYTQTVFEEIQLQIDNAQKEKTKELIWMVVVLVLAISVIGTVILLQIVRKKEK